MSGGDKATHGAGGGDRAEGDTVEAEAMGAHVARGEAACPRRTQAKATCSCLA
jgi:hypothetical protein